VITDATRAWRYGRAVTYDELVDDVVQVVEAFGAAIMVVGGLAAFLVAAWALRRPGARESDARESAYQQLRRSLGRVILLGLEVLIIADIIRTIIVEPTLESVAVLAIIVVIRIVLSFSLEVEIDGAWPWSRSRRVAQGGVADEPD
jgi:uncharacterized membrane protein